MNIVIKLVGYFFSQKTELNQLFCPFLVNRLMNVTRDKQLHVGEAIIKLLLDDVLWHFISPLSNTRFQLQNNAFQGIAEPLDLLSRIAILIV